MIQQGVPLLILPAQNGGFIVSRQLLSDVEINPTLVVGAYTSAPEMLTALAQELFDPHAEVTIRPPAFLRENGVVL